MSVFPDWDSPVSRPESYTESHPVATKLACPCGATLSGDDVRETVLDLWHAVHDDHQEEKMDPTPTAETGE